ncbi:MAG: SAM-dependent methyltransferase [Paludibacteraceae bacterium]|nr:SAM-dependent methyltransferase [Paludibacteraceae bacterium]
MTKQFNTEREGQIAFFNNFRIKYEDNDVLIDNTDGVYNGNLFEFKLNISDLNKVVFQTIKYLSKMRIKGESIPANILIVSLNDETMYVYESKDYFDDIHKVYIGAASVGNEGFSAKPYKDKIDYSTIDGSIKVFGLLKQNNFMPIDLDENCIVGWAERYYRENPTATKGDFIGDDTGKVTIVGEIRAPKHFKGLINPYPHKTNEVFKYLMDKLNDKLRKKDLGAFYTPMPYAEKACELVKMAIDRVPAGNDYIILDRCCGTGNLEQAVLNVLGEEVASHIVCSTYEYYEYKVLIERLGDKVRMIIPPTEDTVDYDQGCVKNADAMSEEYINNKCIKQFVDDPKCTIIMFENPPYRDSSAANKTKSTNSKTVQSFVVKEMTKVKEAFKNTNISTVRDLTNQFVWSGVNYYLRKITDSYILFSPCKWWKSCGIANLTMEKGFLFNRAFFHAGESAITCALWTNIPDCVTDSIHLTAYPSAMDMSAGEIVTIRKCSNTFSNYYEKNVPGDITSVFCESDGTETTGRKCDGKSIYSPSIIAYVTPKGFTFDANNNNLVRMTHYNNRGTYITKKNYLRMLPLFVAKEYPKELFYEKGESGVFFTSSDGGDRYTKDKEFLKQCLIYTCLSNQNKCLSFHGSDGRDYQNELCLDGGALALKDIQSMKLNSDERELINLWDKILTEAKQCANYDSQWRYGVYQISKDLNTYTQKQVGKGKQNVYDYPELNGDLHTLVTKLKAYYKKYITPKMFEYELVK